MRSISQKLESPPILTKIKSGLEFLTDTFHIKVETPMVGGGVVAGEIDQKRPIRVSSIRGHLRYWWRLLNWDEGNGTMRQNEADVWGGLDKRSEISIDITEMPTAISLRRRDNDFGFAPYGTEAYALFPSRQNNQDIAKEGFTFTLQLKYPKRLKDDVRLALSAWIYFGGIGARTRRGCGTLSCQENLVSINEILQKNSNIVLWRRSNPDTNALSAWKNVVEYYRQYRQYRIRPRARSKWPEPDSLRLMTGCHAPTHGILQPPDLLPSFPRAVLGLPIEFHFVKGSPPPPFEKHNLDPYKVQILPRDSNRMSSPVITKALFYNGKWYQAVIILPHEHALNVDTKMNVHEIDVDILPLDSNINRTLAPMNGATNAIAGFENFISKDFRKEMITR